MPPANDPSDEPPFDPAWLAEVRRRSAEVEAGAVLPDPWPAVRERVRGRSSPDSSRTARTEVLATDLLTAFWIVPPDRRGPLGFGVTAHSFDDALSIIRSAGYGDYLPRDVGSLRIVEGVTVAELEHAYVREHMGPIVVRGLWYPFTRVGADAQPRPSPDRRE